MKISIYVKFILIYLMAALLSFIFVTEGTSRIMMNYIITKKADLLYEEAALLSTDYAEDYYRSQTTSSLETVHSHLNAIATYLNADIWMINIDGKVILKSGETLVFPDLMPDVIEHFDPTSFGTSYYMTGDFFGEFSEETLSVIAPINYNYRVRGYLVIHNELSSLAAEKEELLNIVYMTLAVLLFLALLVLLFIMRIISNPLKKITKATSEYASGNLAYQIELNREDEFGHLADSMNLMARELN